MYKKATKMKLRFLTSKGSLSTEQLWDLSRTQLSLLVRNLKKTLKKDSDDELAFLDDTIIQIDERHQLAFDIAKDIYLSKKAENDAETEAAEIKIHNQKIMELIQRKKNIKLEDMSESDLEKLLK